MVNDPLLSQRALRTSALPISFLMRVAVEDPNLISLAAGLVDRESLPTTAIGELLAEMLDDPAAARAACQYGTTEGYLPLRQAIADRYAAGTAYANPERVVVTTGSQQALELLGEACFDPGDIVLVEDPSYFVFTGVLASFGVEARGVATDADGLVVADLDRALADLRRSGEIDRLKAVYTVSYCQNPGGFTLSGPRRQALLTAMADLPEYILLIEDAAYIELVFDPTTRPALLLRGDASGERVATIVTASKPFAPGLKTGFAILPQRLVDPIRNLKGNHDFGSANLTQHLLAKALDTGAFDRQIDHLRAVYQRKAAVLAGALQDQLDADQLTWNQPDGGLYLWAQAPGRSTAPESDLFVACREAGVLYVPGSYAYVPEAGRTKPDDRMRLTYGVADETALVAGAERLAQALAV